VIARQIANAHTGFNLTMTILWLLMLPVLVMLVVKIIPDGKKDQGSHVPVFLDERLLGQPAAALQLVKREAAYGGTLVEDMLLLVQEALEQKGQIGKKCKKKVRQKALQEQALHLQIHNYLAVMFSEGVMTEEQAEEAADLLRRLDEVHHIADRCQDMTEQLWAEKKHKQPLSGEACKDARKSLKNLREMYEMIQAGANR
jgi:phosphate:Na+ symporter